MNALMNLTPHPIKILNLDETVMIAPSGMIARVVETPVGAGEVVTVLVDGYKKKVTITAAMHKGVKDLPDPVDGIQFIVSRPVTLAARGRDDLLVPDDFVRNEVGEIMGCRTLRRML